jgi:BASS family bile acid:Na+ symporter
MLRSLAVVLLVVPLAVLGLILLLRPTPAVAIGLAILVACTAAPMQLIRVASKGGSLPYMVSLHLSLALLALLTVPVTLYLFSLALGFQIEAGVLAVAKVVGMTVLAPVGIGILIRSFFPRVAEAIGPTVCKIGKIVLLISALFVVAKVYRDLFKMDLWSYFTLAVVVVVSRSRRAHDARDGERVARPRIGPDDCSFALQSRPGYDRAGSVFRGIHDHQRVLSAVPQEALGREV